MDPFRMKYLAFLGLFAAVLLLQVEEQLTFLDEVDLIETEFLGEEMCSLTPPTEFIYEVIEIDEELGDTESGGEPVGDEVVGDDQVEYVDEYVEGCPCECICGECNCECECLHCDVSCNSCNCQCFCDESCDTECECICDLPENERFLSAE